MNRALDVATTFLWTFAGGLAVFAAQRHAAAFAGWPRRFTAIGLMAAGFLAVLVASRASIRHIFERGL